MKTIILDTNFLFIPFEKNIDIFDSFNYLMFPYKLAIMSSTYDELENLKNDKTKKAKTRTIVKVVLEMINKYNIEIIQTAENYVDRAIIDLIKNNPKDYVLATGDKELRKKALDLGIYGVIYLRKNKYLEFSSPLEGTYALAKE
ncbi:MAG: hypothetical protein QXS41_00675 [Candidatus Woesearchaeota archaeon]